MCRNKGVGRARTAIDGLSRRFAGELTVATAANTEAREAAMSHAWGPRMSLGRSVLSSGDLRSSEAIMLPRWR